MVMVNGNEQAFDDPPVVVITIQDSDSYIVGGTFNAVAVYSSFNLTVTEDDGR